MEGGEEGGYVGYNEILVSDSSRPISRALLLHRVVNGVLLFMLTVIVGASFYGGLEGRGGRFWGVWWKMSHIVVLFSLIMALKQYKVMLFRVSIAIQIIWTIISLTLLIVVMVDGGKGKDSIYGGDSGMAARILSPIILFWILIQCLIILSGFIVLKEPIRPKSSNSRYGGRRRGNTEFEFGIWADDDDDDDENDENDGNDGNEVKEKRFHHQNHQNQSHLSDDDNDGLSIEHSYDDSSSFSPFNLYASLSSPSGISRYLPLILQTLSILQAILWPLYFVDVVAALMRDSHLEDRKSGVLVGLTVTYHYSMMIWMIASLIISFQFRDKRRTWFASIVSIAYLLFCFTIAIIKLAMWQNDFYSPIFTVIHICILAPWTIAAYYIGTNYFDYSLVPTCCCCCTHAPISSE